MVTIKKKKRKRNGNYTRSGFETKWNDLSIYKYVLPVLGKGPNSVSRGTSQKGAGFEKESNLPSTT